jgi:hypothetical protein
MAILVRSIDICAELSHQASQHFEAHSRSNAFHKYLATQDSEVLPSPSPQLIHVPVNAGFDDDVVRDFLDKIYPRHCVVASGA